MLGTFGALGTKRFPFGDHITHAGPKPRQSGRRVENTVLEPPGLKEGFRADPVKTFQAVAATYSDDLKSTK